MKFDRAIMIALTVGVWALLSIELLGPASVTAHGNKHTHDSYAFELHSHNGFDFSKLYAVKRHSHHDHAKRTHFHSKYSKVDHDHFNEIRETVSKMCRVSEEGRIICQ